MKTDTVVEKSRLDAGIIKEYSEKTKDFLLSEGVSKREALRHALTVEEILIKSQDIGEEADISFGKRFKRPFFELRIKGEPKNVFRDAANDGILNESILKNLGLSPSYSYTGECNEYRFKPKKKKLNPLIVLLITLFAAFALGFLGMLLPESVRTDILEGVLDPVYTAFLGALSTVAGPMIFLSVAWGIYGIGDAASLKTVGKRVLGGYIGTTFLFAFAAMAVIPFFGLHFGEGNLNAFDFKSVFSLLLSMIPSNFVNAFAQGNSMQIIVMALFVGIAMLFLDAKTTAVAKAVDQIRNIIQFIVEFISNLVPYFIGINVVIMIWSDSSFSVAGIGKTLIVMLGFEALGLIAFLLLTAIYNKVSPFKLAKSILPILFIGVSTSSSTVCFPFIEKCAKEDFGVDKRLTSFSVPLGIVVYKGFASAEFSIFMYFLAEYYQLEVSLSWFIMAAITTAVLAISMVPIPGGGLTIYVMMLAQLGIPAEGLAVLLICNSLVDMFGTGFDRATQPLVMLNIAHRLGMVGKKEKKE